MENHLQDLPEPEKWKLMVTAAKKGATAAGYQLERVPGRGLSNVWKASKDGKTRIAPIRTTRDRWFAFPPLDAGKSWKTLDQAELVIVATVDSKEAPQNIEVYIFPADEVRERFDKAYAARVKDNQIQKDGFGFWVALDNDKRGIAASVGSGIVDQYKPVAIYSIKSLLEVNGSLDQQTKPAQTLDTPDDELNEKSEDFTTIAEVITWARGRVAQIAGIGVDAVRLELKLEY